jgi:serine/threonine-protein kinase
MSECDLPRMLGRYRLDDVLGRGAMGIVYKGYDPAIDRVVAIKVVRNDLLDGEAGSEYLDRFRREAQAAGRCMHPNIVAVYDYSESDGTSFIVMEYVKGRPLDHFLRQGIRLAPKEALFVLLQVLDALGYAHGLGIVHRDIKPANVILLEGGRVKVADFGVARLNTTGLTQHGSIIGTPSYMSPEQCKGEQVDHRTDLFSTGVILYELLTGEKPFPGKHATEVMYKLLNHEPREIGELNATVPPGVNAVVRRALAKQPEERYASAQAFADALKAAFAGESAEAQPAYSDQTVVRPSQLPTGPDATGQDAASRNAAGPWSGWDAQFLQNVERDLAYHVGPLAKILVKNAAEKAQDVAELYETLARKIPDAAGRSQFLRRGLRQSAGSSASGSFPGAGGSGSRRGPTATSGAPLPPAAIEAAEAALTFHIGPIAKVLVKKAAGQARSLDDLYERLAKHITDEEERAAFLRKRPRV